MRKIEIDVYTKYFLLRRRTTITLSVWLLTGLLGAFLEAAFSTDGSWITGVFNDPLASLPGLNQRFLFYSFRISGFRKIDIHQANLSEEYIRRNSIVARYLNIIISTVGLSTMFTIFYSYFVLPSPRSVGEVLRSQWLNVVVLIGIFAITFGYRIAAESRRYRNLPSLPDIWKKIYQILIPDEYHSYEEANKKNNRRVFFFLLAFVVLVKSIFYFGYPGVDKITLGGFLITVLIASFFIFGAGLLFGVIPYIICIILRRTPKTSNNLFYIFGALGVLYFIYRVFKVNYPGFFL